MDDEAWSSELIRGYERVRYSIALT